MKAGRGSQDWGTILEKWKRGSEGQKGREVASTSEREAARARREER